MIAQLTCSPQQLVINALSDIAPLSFADALALIDCALDALYELGVDAN